MPIREKASESPAPYREFAIAFEFDAADPDGQSEVKRMMPEAQNELREALEPEVHAFLRRRYNANLIEFEVHEGSIVIAMLVGIYGFLGTYGAARQGLDRLLRDLTRICREVLDDFFGLPMSWFSASQVSERPQARLMASTGEDTKPTPVSVYLLISNAVLVAALVAETALVVIRNA